MTTPDYAELEKVMEHIDRIMRNGNLREATRIVDAQDALRTACSLVKGGGDE